MGRTAGTEGQAAAVALARAGYAGCATLGRRIIDAGDMVGASEVTPGTTRAGVSRGVGSDCPGIAARLQRLELPGTAYLLDAAMVG